MGWDEALHLWGIVLDEVTACATGKIDIIGLDHRECQAACIVLAQIAKDWPTHQTKK
jgi:hypothetical protein